MNKKGLDAKVVVTAIALLAIAGGITVICLCIGALRYVGIALTAVGAVAIVAASVIPKKEQLTTAKYARKKSIMSNCEMEFYEILKGIAGGRYEVMPQAALVSVIEKTTETSYRNELFRIVDFAFLDRRTFAPLLLIELNDSSHNRADRKLRDRKVSEICRKAGLPLVVFTPQEMRDERNVRKTIMGAILKK